MKILKTKKGSIFLSKYLVHSFVFTISLLGPDYNDHGAQESGRVLVKCLFSSTMFSHCCWKEAVPKHSSEPGSQWNWEAVKFWVCNWEWDLEVDWDSGQGSVNDGFSWEEGRNQWGAGGWQGQEVWLLERGLYTGNWNQKKCCHLKP